MPASSRLLAIVAGGVAVAGACALVAVAAAQSSPPTTGWRALPELAEPANTALTSTSLTGAAEAWGDPSTGRFTLIQDYRSPTPVEDTAAAIADVHASLQQTLESSGASIERTNVARDESTVWFQLGTFRGSVRTRATIEPDGALRARSTLCFYNDRERERSEQQCRRFLDSL